MSAGVELVVRTGGRADGGRLHEEEEESGGSGSDDRCGESHRVEDGVRSSGAEVEAMVNCEEERSKLMTIRRVRCKMIKLASHNQLQGVQLLSLTLCKCFVRGPFPWCERPGWLGIYAWMWFVWVRVKFSCSEAGVSETVGEVFQDLTAS